MPKLQRSAHVSAWHLIAKHGSDAVGLASLIHMTQHCFARVGTSRSAERLVKLLALQRKCVAAHAAELGLTMADVESALVDLQQVNDQVGPGGAPNIEPEGSTPSTLRNR